MPRIRAAAPQKIKKGVMYRLSSLSTCFPAQAGSGKDWSGREASPVWTAVRSTREQRGDETIGNRIAAMHREVTGSH